MPLRALLSATVLLVSAEPLFAGEAFHSAQTPGEHEVCLDGERIDCRHPLGRIEQLVCADRARERLERDLSSVYERLLRSFDKPASEGMDHAAAREALIASQAAWHRYVDEDCALGTALFGLGNGASAESVDCRTRQVRARTRRLRGLLEGEE
jgi:uncharacterized protein YecT (DUF1311 family)